MSDDAPDTLTAAEKFYAALMLDAPIPVRHFYGTWGERSTFAAWKAQGLDIRRIDGLGPAIIPSEFKAFLLKKWGHYAPPGKTKA